jgi:Ca2+:H+ antiporter
VLTLTVATGFVAWVSEYLVDSLTVFVEATGISEVFIGVILFPIAGNAAEHVSALTCAWKNKIGISVGIAVGSSVCSEDDDDDDDVCERTSY